MSLKFQKSNEWMSRARKVMPGGVSSPVRSFSSVGGKPFVARKAEGAYVTDVDNNRYIDLVGSWGPMILGHSHPAILEAIHEVSQKGVSFGITSTPEIELCELVCKKIKGIDYLRLVNSGTEACMSAIRLARAHTSREKIIKFEGNYHGHGDAFLVSAGSGLATLGISSSAGVPKHTAEGTIVLSFNDSKSVEKCFDEYGSDIAGVILEVVTGNMGVVMPDLEFLETIKRCCEKNAAVLIFDEVMTGFRLSFSGAQGIFGITPDLTCFGKIIGGGLPLAAYGGKEEIMSKVAPLGNMYQAGTLSGNPLASVAGKRTLEIILAEENLFYQKLDSAGSEWANYLRAHIQHHGYPVSVAQQGSMLTVFFRPEIPTNHKEAKECNLESFKTFFWALMEAGVYFPPSQFEACFLSIAHNEEIIELLGHRTAGALDRVFSGV